MTSRLHQFADAFVARTRHDQLLTLSEGFIKVRCAEVALGLGWTIQEGAGHSPYGPVADYASIRAGRVEWQRQSRRLKLSEGSADLAVVDPFEMLLEIKARPDYGTKSQAQFQQMDPDVARVAGNSQCAFLFVFDPKIYLSFSGEKSERRGRYAVAHRWFVGSFPKIAQLVSDQWITIEAPRNEGSPPICMIARRCSHPYGDATILVLGWRSDARF
jgi:hypothetical protein